MNLLFYLLAFVKESLKRSDADVIQSVLHGNQNDFTILIERYQNLIFAYLFRFLYNNEENAQDVTQNVFLKVYKNLRAIDTSKPIKPWIYRIAHNEALNFIRSHKRRAEFQLEDEDWNKFHNEEPDQLEEAEQVELVKKAIDRLKPKYREVIVLHYFEEKSYEEISAIFNIPRGTVGVLINRAKKQITRAIGTKYFLTEGEL